MLRPLAPRITVVASQRRPERRRRYAPLLWAIVIAGLIWVLIGLGLAWLT